MYLAFFVLNEVKLNISWRWLEDYIFIQKLLLKSSPNQRLETIHSFFVNLLVDLWTDYRF